MHEFNENEFKVLQSLFSLALIEGRENFCATLIQLMGEQGALDLVDKFGLLLPGSD